MAIRDGRGDVLQTTPGSGDIDGAFPHICQKRILIPVPSLDEHLKNGGVSGCFGLMQNSQLIRKARHRGTTITCFRAMVNAMIKLINVSKVKKGNPQKRGIILQVIK